MVKSTRSSQKAKDEENNNGRVTRSSEKAKIKAHPNVSDTAGIRKSSREKPSKIIATSSSTQKSEQVEKGTLPAPETRRKSVRVEKMKTPTPSPLTRSGKTRNHSFSGPSDSKSAGSLGSISRQKLQKEKSVKQLTFEAKEVNENEEHNVESSQVKRKKMTALMYRSLFTQPKKGTLVFCIMSFFFANFLVHSGTSFVTYPNPNVIQIVVNLMVNVKCIVMLEESS
jgi:hypothetical protein